MLYTTLNRIKACSPCVTGYRTLLAALGKTAADDEPVSLQYIFNSNGLDDALWCLRAVDGYKQEIRKLACSYALSVAHLWDIPESVRLYLETRDDRWRHAAGHAAWAAGHAAGGAWAAAWAAGHAAWAAVAAGHAAWAAAAAAGDAAGAARAAAAAAGAAAAAAGDAAWAAGDAIGAEQSLIFLEFLSENGEP